MEEKTKKFMLELARKAIETFVRANETIGRLKNYPKELDVERGVFVTLYKRDGKEKILRGCIGFPYSKGRLIDNVIQAAVSATQDPRFEPLTEEELSSIDLEISILSSPKLIKVRKPQEYLEKITIGEDGLIIKYGYASGLLLPQVPVEQKWNVQEYLENLCWKAGLTPDSWLEKGVEIYKFSAEIISEEM